MPSVDQWWLEVLDPESSATLTGLSCESDWHLSRVKKDVVLSAYLKWFDDVKPKSNDRESNSRIFGRKFLNCVSGGDSKILHANN